MKRRGKGKRQISILLAAAMVFLSVPPMEGLAASRPGVYGKMTDSYKGSIYYQRLRNSGGSCNISRVWCNPKLVLLFLSYSLALLFPYYVAQCKRKRIENYALEPPLLDFLAVQARIL